MMTLNEPKHDINIQPEHIAIDQLLCVSDLYRLCSFPFVLSMHIRIRSC